MYKLSPSDFAYLYEECKLCYCLKIKHGIYQPSMPMPGIFSTINSLVQGNLVGKNLKDMSPDLPDGVVVTQEGWVDSEVIPGTSVYIKGKYDLLVKNPNGTHTIVDLKISLPDESKIEKYKTQLAAYKFALEHPKTGSPIAITKIGLLIFYPDSVSFENGVAKLNFPPRWMEIPIDEKGFLEFMNTVDQLLMGPLPEEGEDCKWCKYRHVGETLTHEENDGEDVPF